MNYLHYLLSDPERSYLLQCGAFAVIAVVVLVFTYVLWPRKKHWEDKRREHPDFYDISPNSAFRCRQIEQDKQVNREDV